MSNSIKSKFPIRTKILVLLTSIQFIYTLDLMIIMPLGSFFMASWGISAAEFGLLISSFAMAGGIASFCATFFIHKYNRLKTLFFIFLLFSIGLWLTSFAPNYYSLLATRIFTGIFGGLLGPLILSEISAQFEYSNRSKPISLTTMALALASILGVPLGLYLAKEYEWRTPFLLLSVLSSIISFLLFLIRNTPPKGEKIIPPAIGKVFKSFFFSWKPLSGLLLTIAIVFSQYSVFIYLAPYLVNNLKITEEQLSLLYLIGGVSVLVFAPIIGYLADKFGKQKVFIGLSFLLIIPNYSITHLPLDSFSIIILISIFYFALDAGRMIPANTLISELVSEHERTSFLSLQSSIKKISIGIAALAGGWVIQTKENHSLVYFDNMGKIALVSILISVALALKVRVYQSSEN